MNDPVFDLHCDTISALLGERYDEPGSLRTNGLHIDLERASRLGGFGQCFALWTYPGLTQKTGVDVQELFRRMLCLFQQELAHNSDRISQARSGAELRRNLSEGRMSAVLTMEGTAGIAYDPERLEELAKAGLRMTTLTWNERNPLAGSHLSGEGLSDRGRAFVKEAQRLGILVDVSHISDRAFWDLVKITRGPIVASHSNSRAVCPVSRNLTDDMFRAIRETGGVVGLNLYTDFLGAGRVTLEVPCRHILHWLELDPEGDHLALGGDLDGCDTIPTGFSDVSSYDRLAEALREHGLDQRIIKKLFWENAVGVMDWCCM